MNDSMANGERIVKRPGIRTHLRAGAEVYVCTVTVVNGKAGPVTCEKLGEMK